MDGSGAFIGLILFIITTIFYFVFKLFFGKDVFKKDENGDILKDANGNPEILYTAESMKKKIYVLYFILVIISQLFVNLSLLSAMCKSGLASVALPGFIYTIVPWLLIFGILKLMFMIMPGWKAPFSNTFGYLVTRIAGLRTILRYLLKPIDLEDDNRELKGEQLHSFQTLREIYKDDSVLINEITPENFDKFWNTMKKSQLFKSDDEIKAIPGTNGKYNLNKLRGEVQWYVGLKDDVSEFVWFLLSGSLISSIVYNNMNKYKCSYTPEQIAEQDKKYKSQVDEKEDTTNTKQVYYTED
jgi:hypothetical protein